MVLDDWRELKRLGDERIARVRALEGFYVLWPRYCSAWTQHLHEVAQGSTYRADPRFLGFCEVGEKPTLPNAMIPVPPSQDGAISMMEYLRRHSRNPRIGLMCFPGTHGEWALWRGVQGQFDYLAHMAASGAAHTYVPVEQERDHYLREIDSYLAMMAGMDLLSQQTLAARIHAYLALDRGPLLRYMISADYQYFNGASPQCSFVPREQEIYVDVGASQGECLGRMAGLVGPGSELWGLEPNRLDFVSLRSLSWLLPIRAERVVAGAHHGGSVEFYTDPDYPHGSRFVLPSDSVQWREDRKEWIEPLPAVSLDCLVPGQATMIKADVEGGELGILEGATRHLADSQCRLSIAAYHYPNDLLSLSRFMQSLGRKRHSVRGHHASVWDLVLYVHEDAR
ncbi:FkbM family methyltransferase [Bordetella holmesii]|uniref:Methyltransferase FkbM domain protein n=2 Tax=Bordetella holmesii TaxID=35814 RepID=A0A158M8F1_9BORD|nr:FkbM family methyltransferase [Bordetella holmesii]AHV91675.1 methyltransferase FkbM domain protein [Bordetella holmesii ATCC 51541]AIT27320.1 methyltransferase FkbM domain protein [Bordetella holmesii 44057]EWM42295.1 methyltransferase FkbM domain protein [Bordetella holmesii 41130]AMD46163.1 hypothetical protein H558_12050 [Bordetella holmesii H558]AMD50532.1 hypothetical protein F783_006005 [Bordetella holmesii F627]